MFRKIVKATIVCALLGAPPAASSDLDDRLNETLRGAWTVLEHEVYSSCSGTYSDNRIGAAGTSSKASRRFDAGELVKIDKIKVKRARVDLLVTLAEPILVARHDGPFELFDEHPCRAQLIFEFPRSVIKGRDLETVEKTIASAVTTHPSKTEAQESADWNGREREPYPEDYQLTLLRYERWKAEQINAAVATGIERATTEAADAADEIERDADYLDGFAAGAEELEQLDIDDCDRLIDASFSSFKERPPSDKSSKWKSGFEDGQRLIFNLHLLSELRHCFVSVPPEPLP